MKQIVIPIILHNKRFLGMRTEEETKYDLDEKIYELYDNGLSIENIAGQVGASSEYIQTLLASVPVESA